MNGDYGNKDIEHSSANKKRHLSFLSLWQSLVIQYLHLFVVMISICPKSGGELSVWLSPPPPHNSGCQENPSAGLFILFVV